MSGEFTKTEQALVDYFNSGNKLADDLKRCMTKNDSIMDTKAITSLNEFVIATYKVADLQFELERRSYKLN